MFSRRGPSIHPLSHSRHESPLFRGRLAARALAAGLPQTGVDAPPAARSNRQNRPARERRRQPRSASCNNPTQRKQRAVNADDSRAPHPATIPRSASNAPMNADDSHALHAAPSRSPRIRAKPPRSGCRQETHTTDATRGDADDSPALTHTADATRGKRPPRTRSACSTNPHNGRAGNAHHGRALHPATDPHSVRNAPRTPTTDALCLLHEPTQRTRGERRPTDALCILQQTHTAHATRRERRPRTRSACSNNPTQRTHRAVDAHDGCLATLLEECGRVRGMLRIALRAREWLSRSKSGSRRPDGEARRRRILAVCN
jgi:hypothetical protein